MLFVWKEAYNVAVTVSGPFKFVSIFSQQLHSRQKVELFQVFIPVPSLTMIVRISFRTFLPIAEITSALADAAFLQEPVD